MNQQCWISYFWNGVYIIVSVISESSVTLQCYCLWTVKRHTTPELRPRFRATDLKKGFRELNPNVTNFRTIRMDVIFPRADLDSDGKQERRKRMKLNLCVSSFCINALRRMMTPCSRISVSLFINPTQKYNSTDSSASFMMTAKTRHIFVLSS